MVGFVIYDHISLTLHVGAIQDGRLIIGVAKYDKNFDDDTVEEPITEKLVKNKIHTSVDSAIKVQVTKDNIIPLSGRWGLAASKLSSSMIGDPSEEIITKRLQTARKMLEKCPCIDLPGGQDQSQKDLILKLESSEVTAMLERASGFCMLKER